MPDENKFKKLGEIGYAIYPCCGLCKHSDFVDSLALWGLCRLRTYQHGKHSDPTRNLGIHRLGRCASGFLLEPVRVAAYLQSYAGLLRRGDDFEELLTDAQAFHISLVYHHDEDCPENCCWEATSPFLPLEFNGAQMGRTEALREAIKAIKATFPVRGS